MPFLSDADLQDWATPAEFDSVLGKNARLQAKLESRTSPMVWITLGAIGGVLYYVARKNIADDRLASAIENVFI
jgi:hypothetical protein